MGGIQRYIRLLLVISFGHGFAIFSLGVRRQYDVARQHAGFER